MISEENSLFINILIFIGYGVLAHGVYKLVIERRKICRNLMTEDMVIVITDPLSEIGKHLTLQLAKRGGKIIMACPITEMANETLIDLRKDSKNENIHLMELNLSSFQSIRKFVNEFMLIENRLDILINNTVYEQISLNNRKTEYLCCDIENIDGSLLEKQMVINYFGPFLLTLLLLNVMYRSKPSRIVMLTDPYFEYATLNKKNINSEIMANQNNDQQNNNSVFNCYGNSRLANILFTRELAKRLKLSGITINSLNLYFIKMEFAHYLIRLFPTLLIRIFNFLSKISTNYSKSGAQKILHISLDLNLQLISGIYFEGFNRGRLFKNKTVNDEELSQLLFEKTEEIVGFKYSDIIFDKNVKRYLDFEDLKKYLPKTKHNFKV